MLLRLCLLWKFEEKIYFLVFFNFLGCTCILSLKASLLYLQSLKYCPWVLCKQSPLYFSLFCLPFLLVKTLVITWSIQTIRENVLIQGYLIANLSSICNLDFYFSFNVTNSQKKTKGIEIGKEEIKPHRWHDYAENSKALATATKQQQQKDLELISEYSNIAECKVNMQKLITFLYANTKNLKFKIIPFSVAPQKWNKYKRNRLSIWPIWGKLQSSTNIKEDLNNGKIFHVHGWED